MKKNRSNIEYNKIISYCKDRMSKAMKAKNVNFWCFVALKCIDLKNYKGETTK